MNSDTPQPTLTEQLLKLHAASEEDWLAQLPELLAAHGLEALSKWRDESNKHKHRLVHTASFKAYVLALKVCLDPPSTPKPQPSTHNPQPSTLNPQP